MDGSTASREFSVSQHCGQREIPRRKGLSILCGEGIGLKGTRAIADRRQLEGNRMRCPRCEGFTVREDLAGINERFLTGFTAWRCVNCGAIGDFIIQAHQRKATPLSGRPMSVTLDDEHVVLRPRCPGRSSSMTGLNMPARIWKGGHGAGGGPRRGQGNQRGRPR